MIMAIRTAYRQPQAGSQGFARTKKVFGNLVNLTAADVVLNAQCAVMRVPKGFNLQAWSGTVGDLDTGATLSFSIGDNGYPALGIAANLARFMATNTVGQAGGALPALALTGAALPYEFPDDTDILLTSTVASVGLGPTPTIYILMEGFVR
jgi:hypothetical protein